MHKIIDFNKNLISKFVDQIFLHIKIILFILTLKFSTLVLIIYFKSYTNNGRQHISYSI